MTLRICNTPSEASTSADRKGVFHESSCARIVRLIRYIFDYELLSSFAFIALLFWSQIALAQKLQASFDHRGVVSLNYGASFSKVQRSRIAVRFNYKAATA
jgi:hypothetical protein